MSVKFACGAGNIPRPYGEDGADLAAIPSKPDRLEAGSVNRPGLAGRLAGVEAVTANDRHRRAHAARVGLTAPKIRGRCDFSSR